MPPLSPAGLVRARSSYLAFNAMNALAFTLLSGSFVTLYALRLGATNAMVGVINAFVYGTFFFLPLGKRLVRRRRIVAVFGWGWTLRYLAMLPALAAPALAAAGFYGAAFGLILAGVAGFNFFRGVGLIGNNPVLVNLAEGGAAGRRSDKGAFLITVQIVGSTLGLFTNLAVALLIGKTAAPSVYALAMGVGIAVGLVGTAFLFRSPEPEDYRPAEGGSLWRSAREAFRDRPFRAFIEVLLVLAFVSGMARSFLPVYAKEAFGQGDDAVMAFSLVGSVGALAMGLLTRLLVDRLGSKPLYVIYTAVSVLSLTPLALLSAPAGSLHHGGFLAFPIGAAIFLGAVNFLSAFGFAGEETAGQTYFFGLVKPERTLDLGVVYFLVYGLGGSLGSGAGGLLLDFLAVLGMDHAIAYRVFYGLLVLVLLLVILRMGKLIRLGSASVRESLEIMLSIRDLRSFNLLARLERSADPAEEVELIHEIGATAGRGAPRRAERELAAYLSSPRFEVRVEALLALEKMRSLGPEVVDSLVAEVDRQPFTTAYVAARILGKDGCAIALPCLRRAARAEDYMLQASAVIALARLGDRESVDAIEEILSRAENPRVRISAAYALELLGSRGSVPVIVSCLRRERSPAFVEDELVLSSASILGLMPRFYGMYSAFLDDEAAGIAILGDAAAERDGALPERATDISRIEALGSDGFRGGFRTALMRLLAAEPDGAPMSAIIMSKAPRGDPSEGAVDLVLAEAALDPGLAYKGFRFLIAAYAALR